MKTPIVDKATQINGNEHPAAVDARICRVAMQLERDRARLIEAVKTAGVDNSITLTHFQKVLSSLEAK